MATKKKAVKNTEKQSKLTMRLTLLLFSLIPLIVASVIIGSVSINKSKKELKSHIKAWGKDAPGHTH